MNPYYQEPGITIYHGDCRKIMRRLAPVDLLLTDPPYGIGAARKSFHGECKRHRTGIVRGPAIQWTDFGDAAWDDAPADPKTLAAAVKLARWQIVWGGNYFDLGPARCFLVWDKLRGETNFADAELAWTNLDRAVRVIRWKWNGFLQELKGRDKERRYHPTQKPLSVMVWAIKQASPEWHSILDPFMGSGTTLLAAKRLGRRAIGIELEEKYCEIAAKRLAQEVFDFAAEPKGADSPKEVSDGRGL